MHASKNRPSPCLSHHGRVVGEGVQVPHVAVHQPPDVLHLRAQVLVGGVRAQHSDPKRRTSTESHRDLNATSASPRPRACAAGHSGRR